jgi:hypothetical protein
MTGIAAESKCMIGYAMTIMKRGGVHEFLGESISKPQCFVV